MSDLEDSHIIAPGFEMVKIPDNVPCHHSACHSHWLNPCEVCGRVACQGEAIITRKIITSQEPINLQLMSYYGTIVGQTFKTHGNR